MKGSYDPLLVALSVVIAIVAAYVSLALAARVTASRGRIRQAWLLGGSVSMGIGIWSMHFVGMLAFRLPIPMAYDIPLWLLSAGVSIAASLLALLVVSRPEVSGRGILGAGLCMGGAIAGMHYIGMAAMRVPARVHYHPGWVLLSILIAIGASVAALGLFFRFREGEQARHRALKWLSAGVMGLAISGMHYTAMAAARFTRARGATRVEEHYLLATDGLALSVVVSTLVILGLALLGATVDRRRQLRARLALLFQQAPAAICVTRGPDHVIETANPAYLQLVGGRDLVGKPVREAFPELMEQGFIRLLDEVYSTGHAYVGDEVRVEIERAGGWDEAYFNFVYQPLTDADGRVDGIMVHAVEVTEQVRAREQVEDQAAELELQNERLAEAQMELEQANEELQRANAALERQRAEAEKARAAADEANAAKSAFLATMSHELRTPLNAISGYAELLALGIRGALNEAQLEDIERIRHNQAHLLGLINDVLNFAKIEAGQVRYRIADVPVDPTLLGMHALIEPQVQAKGLSYQYHRGDPEVTAHVDRERLEQIVLNLLTNAVKFTPPGGRIVLEWEAGGAEVRIRVRDTGRGIPSAKRETIFEPFVQVDPALTRESEGTGLGLAISRDLARAMGGDLSVESAPDRGSVFTLTVPAGPRRPAPRVAVPDGHEAGAG